jgi:Histidine kinase-, DNA gyrase B-, and HSP90-like ATPase
MGKKNHELIPSARRLITSLRDMGYDFASAVADVVDNSIEAYASRVNIEVRTDGDESWVRIHDNGRGMKPAQVREALRYGAAGSYDEQKALGKFGLGLKTASMSQCQHLLVASRSNAGRPDISAYAWDLEHVLATDSWEILDVGRDEHSDHLRDPLLSHTGTVVLWRRLDRILGYKHPYGGMIKKRLEIMCRELEEHLAMVFHRFIAGEDDLRKVRISINGSLVKPWDPFVRGEKATKKLPPVVLQYDHEGVQGCVTIEAHVLPHQDEFSSPAAHAAAAGPMRWNRQQGFYIYRAGRMVQGGGWSNLRTMDEHTKLARVGVSFDPRLDEAFRINVAKMRVQIPRQLREQIDQAIAPVIKAAQVAYRRADLVGGKAAGQDGTEPERAAEEKRRTHSARPSARTDIQRNPTRVNGSVAPLRARLWTIEELLFELERVATKDERPVIRAVVHRLPRGLSAATVHVGNREDDPSRRLLAARQPARHRSDVVGEA